MQPLHMLSRYFLRLCALYGACLLLKKCSFVELEPLDCVNHSSEHHYHFSEEEDCLQINYAYSMLLFS